MAFVIAEMFMSLVTIVVNLFWAVARYLPPMHSLKHDLAEVRNLPRNLVACLLVFVLRDRSDVFLSPYLGDFADDLATEITPTSPLATKQQRGRVLQALRDFSRFYPDASLLDGIRARLQRARQLELARSKRGRHAGTASASSSQAPTPVLRGKSGVTTPPSSVPPSPILGAHQQQQVPAGGSFATDSELAAVLTRSASARGDEADNEATLTGPRALRRATPQPNALADAFPSAPVFAAPPPPRSPTSPVPAVYPHLLVPFAFVEETEGGGAGGVRYRMRRGIDSLITATGVDFLSTSASIAAAAAAEAASSGGSERLLSSPTGTPPSLVGSLLGEVSTPPSVAVAKQQRREQVERERDAALDDADSTDGTTAIAARPRRRRGATHQRQQSGTAFSAGASAAPTTAASAAAEGGSVPRRLAARPPRRTLCLDLDEMLISSQENSIHRECAPIPPDFMEIVPSGTATATEVFNVYVRPYAGLFLRSVARHYHLVVFTASTAAYAHALVARLDKWGVVRRIYAREHCTPSAVLPSRHASSAAAATSDDMPGSHFGGGIASHALSSAAQQRQHHQHRHGHHHHHHHHSSAGRHVPTYLKDLTRVDPDLSRVLLVDNCAEVIYPGQQHCLITVPDFLPVESCERHRCRDRRGRSGGAARSASPPARDNVAGGKNPGAPLPSGLISLQRQQQQQLGSRDHVCQYATDTALLDLLPFLEALSHVPDVRAVLQHRRVQST